MLLKLDSDSVHAQADTKYGLEGADSSAHFEAFRSCHSRSTPAQSSENIDSSPKPYHFFAIRRLVPQVSKHSSVVVDAACERSGLRKGLHMPGGEVKGESKINLQDYCSAQRTCVDELHRD